MAKGAYGDGLDRVRRSQPRTVAADLLWQLLPPLTFGADRFVVSAFLEPTNKVAGELGTEHRHPDQGQTALQNDVISHGQPHVGRASSRLANGR